MDALNNLGNNITIVMIAHRLSTIKKCDIIYKIDKGNVVAKGRFDELLNNN